MNYEDNYYLAGLADGEGRFQLRSPKSRTSYQFHFAISQREDRQWLLEELCEVFGGGVTISRGVALWQVSAKRDVAKLITYFDKFPPHLKAEEYVVWRNAADLYYAQAKRGRRQTSFVLERMAAAKIKLHALKENMYEV